MDRYIGADVHVKLPAWGGGPEWWPERETTGVARRGEEREGGAVQRENLHSASG